MTIKQPVSVRAATTGPDVAPEGVSDWDRPGRIAARLARYVEVALAELDLSLSQYRTLMNLSDRAAMASALARTLTVTPPSVTAVIDGLVARGLVERQPYADDRRRVQLVLTPEGRRLLAEADERVDDRLTGVAASQDDHEPEETLEGLRLWRAALDSSWVRKFGVKA